MRHRRTLGSYCIVLAAWGAALSISARAEDVAHKGQEIEVGYADAVLAFNSRNFRKALEHLDELLKIDPKNVPALELQALALKSQGDDRRSLTSYRQLIQLKPENERAPYYFEAATIYYKNKKLAEARPLFERAVAGKFNVGASQFFLGNIAFQANENPRAERHFEAVLRDAPDELKVASHYYLGILRSKRGYGAGATHAFIAARDLAQKLPESETAKQVSEAANAALQPYSAPQWFGNVTVITQYDGNVSLASDTLSATETGAADQASPKAQLVAGFGRMSSPLATWQWVASYRLAYNKNFNAAVADYEFFSNVPALYLTHEALAKTHYGLKIEGNYTFKNTESSDGSSRTYRPFNRSIEAGPYFRTSLRERVQLGLELFVRPTAFPQESTTGDDRRSGIAQVLRTSLQVEGTSRWLAPNATLTVERSGAKGANFQSLSGGLELGNSARLSPKDELSLTAAFTYTSYANATPVRSDQTYYARLGYVRSLTPRMSVIGDASYTINQSDVDTFTFKKPVVSLGVSYSL